MLPTHVSQPDISLLLLDGRELSDEHLVPCISWLNPEELSRYHRFIRPQRQRQFLIGRSLLRLALGKLLGVTPARISLRERDGNAPVVNWPTPAPFFSISHSGAWVACAISRHFAVGLDIEVENPKRDLDALAQQVFDAPELEQLSKLSGHEKLKFFYELWSHQEARYKLRSNLKTKIDSNGTSTIDTKFRSKYQSEEVEHFVVFAHPELSVVLCGELALPELPKLTEVSWPTLFS